jgi:hypothetical protein
MGRKPVYTFATWRVKDGQLAAVLGLLAELTAKSTAEEGSLLERNCVVPYPRLWHCRRRSFCFCPVPDENQNDNRAPNCKRRPARDLRKPRPTTSPDGEPGDRRNATRSCPLSKEQDMRDLTRRPGSKLAPDGDPGFRVPSSTFPSS